MTTTKETILEVAFRLFLEQGYDNTSISDIVTASGFSKGAVYHHFKDKDALHDATIDHFFLSYFADVEAPQAQGLEVTIDDLTSGYIRLLEAIAKITPDRIAYYRFLFAVLPKVKPAMVEQIAVTRARLIAAVEYDQHAGLLAPSHSPERIADQCLALIEGTGLLLAIEDQKDIVTSFRNIACDLQKTLQNI